MANSWQGGWAGLWLGGDAEGGNFATATMVASGAASAVLAADYIAGEVQNGGSNFVMRRYRAKAQQQTAKPKVTVFADAFIVDRAQGVCLMSPAANLSTGMECSDVSSALLFAVGAASGAMIARQVFGASFAPIAGHRFDRAIAEDELWLIAA